jgi:ribonuclease P protein component
VFANPRRLATEPFNLLFAPSLAGQARLGLAVSRRQAPTAVERNRIKRIVRESFRRSAEALAAVDIVILLRVPTSRIPAVALRAALDSLWSRLPQRNDGPIAERA